MGVSQQITADASGAIPAEDRLTRYVIAIGVLIGSRFIAAAVLPLYFGDEPYYWVWSKNLAWGYFDHPPAIAFLIRAGTTLFGDTEFGIRFFGLVLSIPASMCVWRTGTLLLGTSKDGARAALFFNLMLLVNAVTLLATPDAPVLFCSAAFIWAVAEADASKDGRWWLAAGLFAGLGLLSKYVIVFVGVGIFVWLVLTANGRRWLATPWPWLGGLIAALVFAPNVIWNVTHDNGGALGFQFHRRFLVSGFRWYYVPQFIGEQILLASPGILILGMIGLWSASKSNDQPRFLLATLLWPAIAFFAMYVFFARVHRNWCDVVYPALAIAAADAFRAPGSRFIRKHTIGVAVGILVVVYGQMLLHPISLARYDPFDHHLASTMRQRAVPIAQVIADTNARAILTTDFPVMSWLRFYLRPQIPLIKVAEEYRFPDAPRATAEQLQGPLIYVALHDDMLHAVKRGFSQIEQIKGLQTPLLVYRVNGFKGEPYGRIP